MTPVWAQRREALWRDCLVSPDVFHQMVERLGAFVLPDQQVLETEADPHSLPLSLQGLRSHLPRKNAEAIAVWVDVERQVLQDFIGIAPWDHRPLIGVLVGHVAKRVGESDGIIAFDPSSFPKRGTHAVGVKRQWCGHRGQVDNGQVGVFMGDVSAQDHALRDFRWALPQEWARDQRRRQECATDRQRCATTRGRSSAWRCARRGGSRCHTAGSPVRMHWVATPGFARPCASAARARCWGCPAPRRFVTWRPHSRSTQGVDGVPRPRGNR